MLSRQQPTSCVPWVKAVKQECWMRPQYGHEGAIWKFLTKAVQQGRNTSKPTQILTDPYAEVSKFDSSQNPNLRRRRGCS